MKDTLFPIIGSESRLPLYLVDAGYSENELKITRNSGFPAYQLIYCTRGRGILRLGGEEYPVLEQTGFLLYPKIRHEYEPVEAPWETHWLAFDGQAVPGLLNYLGFSYSGMLYFSETKSTDRVLEQLLQVSKSGELFKGCAYSALLYRSLMKLKSVASYDQSLSQRYKIEKIRSVLTFVDENYYRSLSLQEMADSIEVTPQYLCLLFRTSMNLSPIQYLLRYRIEEAKRLLLETRLPIRKISERCGFSSHSYFSFCFRRFEKMAPEGYRRLHGRTE